LLPEAKPTKMSDPETKNDSSELQPAAESSENVQQSRRRRNRTRHLEPSVNMDELRELVDLIQANGFAEFELEREGFRLHVRREAGPADVGESSDLVSSRSGSEGTVRAESAGGAGSQGRGSSSPVHPGAQAESAASEDQDLQMIPSPIVGTFYRAASPSADPFVKIGSNVEPDSVVCIIEAMKLMNEIQAETTGEVVKIYVENGQPVEYGQPLFGIKR
jgi:acetyl-CoA carboxylase biotin carboxyl carrier protein